MNCGHRFAVFQGTKVVPDFDTSEVLPPELQLAFSERMDGICSGCGIYQAYKRFTLDELRLINSLGKDITTSEKAFQSFPVPAEFIERFNRLYFSKRLDEWRRYFLRIGIRPASCLFIRSYFGATASFMQNEFGSAVAGVDMSPACLRTASETVHGFKPLPGIINGMLEGEFLDSGPYDGIFVMHTLTHACDVHKMLGQIRGLLKPDGFVLFSHEVNRKPTNPFHMIHLSETQLRSLLLQHFARADRIDDCDENAPKFITNYTLHGDSPDLVAWK